MTAIVKKTGIQTRTTSLEALANLKRQDDVTIAMKIIVTIASTTIARTGPIEETLPALLTKET